jgi:hypothetical protein
LDLLPVIESLRTKRTVFHSEADLQFALAWHIQRLHPAAEVRLEYPSSLDTNKYIDILVRLDGKAIPIELKYKTKKVSLSVDGESFPLKNHVAHDTGCYDLVKDISRIESMAGTMEGCAYGYVLWVTNDPYYWTGPKSQKAGYVMFSVHEGAVKSGSMRWSEHLGKGTIRGREDALHLRGSYDIRWHEFSDLSVPNGLFKFVWLKCGV